MVSNISVPYKSITPEDKTDLSTSKSSVVNQAVPGVYVLLSIRTTDNHFITLTCGFFFVRIIN